jgi:hypothetical protein
MIKGELVRDLGPSYPVGWRDKSSLNNMRFIVSISMRRVREYLVVVVSEEPFFP